MTNEIRRDDPHQPLSPRQLELLKLLSSELTLSQAADRMGITLKTATDHKCKIMYRLQLETRGELIAYGRDAFPELKSENGQS